MDLTRIVAIPWVLARDHLETKQEIVNPDDIFDATWPER